LNKLKEIHSYAYESSKLYEERKKRWHDKNFHWREFRLGDLVLHFNSRLKLFLGKLCSWWSGPFVVKKVFPYGVVEVGEGPYVLSK